MTAMLADEYSGKNDDKKPLIATRDNGSKDLWELINDCAVDKDDKMAAHINTGDLMMKLCSYIVRRDHTVHNHAYHLGKESNEEK